MTTAPFDPQVREVIAASHYQDLTATAVPAVGDPIPLDVLEYDVEWDENRSPRLTVTLTCTLVAEADLERLDPRDIVRVPFSVAYRLPDGTLDSHQLGNPHLRVRRVRRPDNTMTLTLAGDEFLIIDAAPDTPFYEGVLLHDSAVAFITQTINEMTAGTPIDSPEIEVTTRTDGGEFTYDAFPVDRWAGIIDAADALDASVYDNGDNVFRVTPRRYVTAASSLTLTHGENGTIVRTDTGIDRDQWWNEATILWTWNNRSNPTLPDRTWGIAYVDAGPSFPQGRRRFTEQRTGQVNAFTAGAIAKTVLRRLRARARTYTIEAVAAWWVRPEDTVTIQLPTGDQERHLVASVSFRTGGTMILKTRLPDNAVVIGE